MSTLAGKAYHPINGATVEVWEGFSWPCLFFGSLWYISKGMWGLGVISLVLAVCTLGISWLIFPFFANEHHAQSLLKQGYLNEKQWAEKNQNSNEKSIPSPMQQQKAPLVADELLKLAQLKEQGVLSDEEFNKQKHKLLS
jgi:hypothetical protein